MTVADGEKKPKGRKKGSSGGGNGHGGGPRDPVAELAAAMQASMAAQEAEARSDDPGEPATKEPATKEREDASAPAAKTAPKTSSRNQPPPAPEASGKETPKEAPAPAPSGHEPESKRVDWASVLVRIAEHTNRLMQVFLSRNPDLSVPAVDPLRITGPFVDLLGHLLGTPERLVETQLNLWRDYTRLWQTSLARMAGEEAPPVISPAPTDKRFQDPAWREVWFFDFLKQSYLLASQWAQGLVRKADGLDPKTVRKIDFYTRQMVDAIAPSNFWLTNPEVLRAIAETGGENLVKGFENLLEDMERGRGQLAISMTDAKAFRLGENLATTPGKVVFQNDLMQMIQYAPQTAEVYKTPLLVVPPWINKYYVLDMRPKNSFVRYLVEQGHTVFCLSWVNPDSRHGKVDFDDYMESGILAALQAIRRLSGEDAVNVVGYCIGGTLLASTLAWLEAAGDRKPEGLPRVASATYLVTLVDFAEPGDLGVFMDEDQIAAIESRMAGQGYLDAAVMGATFSMLRANDLIWSFVINNYLLGREPFPFDLLFWNADSTNLPAAMQSFYLRNMYLNNKLVRPDALTMKGVPIDLRRIATPSFLLSTRDDHIAPWRSTYAATRIYKGPTTFVLSASGHIAGVINPPGGNKYGHWTNEGCPDDPEAWFKTATAREGSWWPTWIEWLKTYAGPKVSARPPGCGQPTLEDAPGSYVRVRVV